MNYKIRIYYVHSFLFYITRKLIVLLRKIKKLIKQKSKYQFLKKTNLDWNKFSKTNQKINNNFSKSRKKDKIKITFLPKVKHYGKREEIFFYNYIIFKELYRAFLCSHELIKNDLYQITKKFIFLTT
jgi:hypothetical protein